MKRPSLSGELIFSDLLLLVRNEVPVVDRKLFPHLDEALLHQLRTGIRIVKVDRHLEQLTGKEASLHGGLLSARQETFPRLNAHDSKQGLISGQRNVYVQAMSGSPRNQLFRSIAPFESVGRLQHPLGSRLTGQGQQARAEENQKSSESAGHSRSLSCRKVSCKRGSVLLEAMMSLSILTILGLVLLKLSINVLYPRQWSLQQTLSDAYLTYEVAYAQRIPFEELTSSTSPFPAFPTTTTSSAEVGRVPGNKAITATVTRTRIPDPDNYPIDGGTGTLATNPAAMKIWKVQSILNYKIGNRNYVKSRTVIRSQ